MTETPEQYDERIKLARVTHEKRLDGVKVHASQILTFGSDAMKAPALVGLGGLVALLGFYSANYQRLSESPVAMQAFGSMLFYLFWALVATVAAPGFAYLSQMAYTRSIYNERFDFEAPFVHETPKSSRFNFAGDCCRWTAVVLVAVSILFLIRAGWLFSEVVA